MSDLAFTELIWIQSQDCYENFRSDMQGEINLKAIGVIGDHVVGAVTLDSYEPLLGAVELNLRAKIAAYLRSGTIIFAIMEQTQDIVGGQFTVPGGSGIASDGTYFWRVDTAAYVEKYGLAIDLSAIGMMQRRGWRARQLSADESLVIDQFLYRIVMNKKD